MIRRRTAGLTAASVLAVTLLTTLLAGCTSSPTDDDRAAEDAWAQTLLDASGTGVGGKMSVESGDLSTSGTRIDFTSPAAFRAVELRCKGTDRAQFTLRYTSASGELTVTQEIVCHDGGPLTPIAIPTSVGALTALTANAGSPDGNGSWVAIPQE